MKPNKITPFPSESTARFVSAKEIQKRLQAVTGYDKNRVRVRAHDASMKYIDLIISCPIVSVKKVEQFAKSFKTDKNGQSIDVVTTRHVDDSDARRFSGEANEIVMALTQPGQCRTATNGATVNCVGLDFLVSRDGGESRYGGDRYSNLSSGCRPLALAIARS